MSRDDHTAREAFRANQHCWAVIEASHALAFRTLLGLIGRDGQAGWPERMMEHGIVFAAGDKGEVGHICEHRPSAILPIEPQQSMPFRELVRCEIARDRRERLAQFRAVASIAAVAKTAEPVVAMSLSNHRARPDDLPALATGVARGTHVI